MKKEKEETQDSPPIQVSNYMPFFESCVQSFLELENVNCIFRMKFEMMFLFFQVFGMYSHVLPKPHPVFPDSHSLLWPAKVR